MARAEAALAQNADWELALDSVLRSARSVVGEPGGVDLALLFASAAYADRLPDVVHAGVPRGIEDDEISRPKGVYHARSETVLNIALHDASRPLHQIQKDRTAD